MATFQDQSVQTGNSVYIKAGKNIIGRAQSLSGERQFGTEGVYEIGSIMPQEHVFLKYTGTITLERMKVRTKTLEDLNLGALGEEVLSMGVIDISVMDNKTNKVIVTYKGCSINTNSETLRANDIISDSVQFYYLKAYKADKAPAHSQSNGMVVP